MPTRRSLLKRLGGGLAVVGVGSTAGCVSSNDGGDGKAGTPGGPSAPAYADPLYDPTSILPASTSSFLSYDLGVLYEKRGQMPEGFASAVERYDERYDAIDISKVGRMTTQLYTEASAGELDPVFGGGGGAATTPTSTPKSPGFGMSFLLEGSFQPDSLVGLMRSFSGSMKLKQAGSASGHDLYSVEQSSQRGSMFSVPSTTMGVSEESVVAGVTQNADATGKDAATATLSARGDDTSEYYQTDDAAAAVMDALGDASAVGAAAGNLGGMAGNDIPDKQGARAVATGLRGAGAGSTFDGETVSSTLAAVYEEGQAPSKSDLQGLLDEYKQSSPDDGSGPTVDDISLAVDGQTVTASLDATFEDVFSNPSTQFGMFGGIVYVYALPAAAFLTLAPQNSGPRTPPEPAGPQVSWDFEYDSGGSPSLQITHNGGDFVEAKNLRVVVQGEGSVRTKKQGTIEPGDEFVTATSGLSGGDTVRVVWTNPEDGTSRVMGSYRVPSTGEETETAEPAPNVAWEFEYDSEASPALKIVHGGGDTVQASRLRVIVTKGSRGGVGKVALKQAEAFAAGDQIVAQTSDLDSGETARVVWTDGGGTLLASYTIP